ncbi:MAG: hypothetical protein KME07_13795 [Pegethrix bostrychoides GSE-TBD4-15B]|uniref:Uncharacterized protein n=1 Tax=Pegethrix bostrychoides GSE-TBD4-15B TaxID=2839662 RepID=A0A951PBN7_9CYAN|nr:hypothetical protein [Pegethrix bostrychoides GSE-TBD4-15B]
MVHPQLASLLALPAALPAVPLVAQLVPAPILGICVWGALASFICSLWVAIREAAVQLKKLHQVPCDQCTYFTGSCYLKCAVNPSLAFTEAAIDCHDFVPASERIAACSACAQPCAQPHKQ